MKCPSCNATTINNIPCHETSCPDSRLQLVGKHEGQYWHECKQCGCDIFSDNRHAYKCCEYTEEVE